VALVTQTGQCCASRLQTGFYSLDAGGEATVKVGALDGTTVLEKKAQTHPQGLQGGCRHSMFDSHNASRNIARLPQPQRLCVVADIARLIQTKQV
jgi:hypothetical protein